MREPTRFVICQACERGRCAHCSGTGKVLNGEYLRYWRETHLKITLREMARRLNFTPSYISDIELNRRRPTDRVTKEYGL